jgi:hypothetical protein
LMCHECPTKVGFLTYRKIDVAATDCRRAASPRAFRQPSCQNPRGRTLARVAMLAARPELPDDPETDARMRAWLERAKWGHGPSRDR